MATRPQRRIAYGLTEALSDMAPRPIVTTTNPTTADQAELGTLWVNRATGTVFCLASITVGAANWVSSPAGGATVLASLQVTGAAGIVVDQGDIDVTLGDINVAAGDITLPLGDVTLTQGNLDVTNGNITVGGDLTVGGTIALSDLSVTSAALISLVSTLDAAPSILLQANGGVAESIQLVSLQGTGTDAIFLNAGAGGIEITAAGGDIALSSSADSVVIDGAEAALDAVQVRASNAGGGVIIDSNGEVEVVPDTATVASPTVTATVDKRVIVATFTGFTTAMGASETFTIVSDKILATSGVMVNVANLNASLNDAFLTIDGIIQSVGSLDIAVTNNGAAALGAGDNILISVWVLS